MKYPLSFALVAAVLAVLCFQLFPTWHSGMGFVDTGALRQSASAALVLATLYLFSGECLLGSFLASAAEGLDRLPSETASIQAPAESQASAEGKNLRTAWVAAAVLLAAVAIGIAKVLVQKSTITPPRMAILIFMAILLATAVFEEILFRGLFFEAFTQVLQKRQMKKPLLVAALASSALFGLLHVSSDLGSLFRLTAYVQAIVKTLEGLAFGLAMCALYVKTRSAWPCVAVHAVFDIVSEGPIYLATGAWSASYITGSPADIAVLALGTAILLPVAKWAWSYLSHARATIKA